MKEESTMSFVTVLAADKQLPLCNRQEWKETEIGGGYTIGMEQGFRVDSLDYYRSAVDELGLDMKLFRYELSCDVSDGDCANLVQYLRDNFAAGETAQLWGLWVDDIPVQLHRFRGTIDQFDLDTLGMLSENGGTPKESQVCLTIEF